MPNQFIQVTTADREIIMGHPVAVQTRSRLRTLKIWCNHCCNISTTIWYIRMQKQCNNKTSSCIYQPSWNMKFPPICPCQRNDELCPDCNYRSLIIIPTEDMLSVMRLAPICAYFVLDACGTRSTICYTYIYWVMKLEATLSDSLFQVKLFLI